MERSWSSLESLLGHPGGLLGVLEVESMLNMNEERFFLPSWSRLRVDVGVFEGHLAIIFEGF